ncbi:MAG: glycine zipper 2TM domain-containing protein [Gammaproteobacteria bacterium]|nr:MAG: glycine zipper 2TM domain-containing protein [Gammaproteobacteria bacterium]
MNNEGKKILMLLGGAAGIAIIVVLTTWALQAILQRPAVVPPSPPIEKPVVEQPVVPVTPTAQVINVKPHYTSTSIPKRQCHEAEHVVYVSQETHSPGAGAVIGGVAGGLLGSQVGGGTGRIVTSAAGAAIGALTGNSMQNSMNAPQPHAVHSVACSTHYVKTSVQNGYEVTYTYDGKQGVVIMNNPPMVGSVLPLPLN